MKKIIHSVFLLLLCVCASVSANENKVTVTPAFVSGADGSVSGKITVKYSFGESFAGKKYTVSLIRSETDETDDSISEFKKYAMIYQGYISTHGEVDYTFDFNDISGNYIVRIAADGFRLTDSEGNPKALEHQIYFPSAYEMTVVNDGLKNKTLTASALMEILDSKAQEIALDDSVYSLFPKSADGQRYKTAEYIVNNSDVCTVEEFIKNFEKAVIINGIGSGSDDKIIKAAVLKYNGAYFKLEENPLYNDFSSLSEANKNLVYAAMTEFTVTDIPGDIKKSFYKALALTKMKSITSQNDVSSIINTYKDYCIADEKLYTFNSFNLNQKAWVSEYITNNLLRIDSFENLVYHISYAIDNISSLAPPTVNNTSSSGGGGGGIASGSRKPIVLEEMVQPVKSKAFSDISEDFWGYKAIISLSDKHIISGRGDGRFYPADKITRAEFVKMTVLAFDIDCDAPTDYFTDVPESAWEYKYVAGGVRAGIVSGQSEKIFAPAKNITRQDAALILYRVAGKALQSTNNNFEIKDENDINEYALSAVRALYGNGVIKGYEDGSFRPTENVTRAEAVQLIYNITEGGI